MGELLKKQSDLKKEYVKRLVEISEKESKLLDESQKVQKVAEKQNLLNEILDRQKNYNKMGTQVAVTL